MQGRRDITVRKQRAPGLLSYAELQRRRRQGQRPHAPNAAYHQRQVGRAARKLADALGNFCYRVHVEPDYIKAWSSYARSYQGVDDDRNGVLMVEDLAAKALPALLWVKRFQPRLPPAEQSYRRVQRALRRFVDSIDAMVKNLDRKEALKKLGRSTPPGLFGNITMPAGTVSINRVTTDRLRALLDL